MMILFDCTRPVKPTRSFGRGILPPWRPYEPSPADWAEYCAWARQTDAEADVRDWDAEAEESSWLDSLEAFIAREADRREALDAEWEREAAWDRLDTLERDMGPFHDVPACELARCGLAPKPEAMD